MTDPLAVVTGADKGAGLLGDSADCADPSSQPVLVPWTPDLPTDSHLLMYLFAGHLAHPDWLYPGSFPTPSESTAAASNASAAAGGMAAQTGQQQQAGGLPLTTSYSSSVASMGMPTQGQPAAGALPGAGGGGFPTTPFLQAQQQQQQPAQRSGLFAGMSPSSAFGGQSPGGILSSPLSNTPTTTAAGALPSTTHASLASGLSSPAPSLLSAAFRAAHNPLLVASALPPLQRSLLPPLHFSAIVGSLAAGSSLSPSSDVLLVTRDVPAAFVFLWGGRVRFCLQVRYAAAVVRWSGADLTGDGAGDRAS